jgi:hypothetical protein
MGTAMARWPEGCLNYCGFEGYWDEAGWRDGDWHQGGTEGMAFDRQTKFHGKSSLRVEGAADQTRFALQLGGFPVDRAQVYLFRAAVKTQEIVGEAALAVQVHSATEPGPFLDLGPGAKLSGTHDWTWLEVRVTNFPANAARMYPYVWVKGTGRAWFDEVSLAEEGVAVPLGGQRPITDADYAGLRFDDARLPENLLLNGGFEQGVEHWYIESGKPVVEEVAAAVGALRASPAVGAGLRASPAVGAGLRASPDKCLRFDGFAECGYSVVQRVRIDPRRAYRLSVRQKTALTAGLSCLQVIAFKADGSGFGWWFAQDHTWEFLYGRGTQDWHEQSLVLREFPPETDFINVYLVLQDALGTVWFDDVRLTPLSLEETRREQAK